MAHIVVFCHVPFEGIGLLEGIFAKRGDTVELVRWYAGETPGPNFPGTHGSPQRCDLLLIMGGPMSVHDEDAYPWLLAEKAALRLAIDNYIAVLGICLGAQLLAQALGARVYPNTQKEIGWFPVDMTPEPWEPTRIVSTKVFHWHGDTFDLPEASLRLASSAACTNQAFVRRGNLVGLQFHLECGPTEVATMIEHGASELVAGPYIQDAPTMSSLAQTHDNTALLQRIIFILLAHRPLTSLTLPVK